jgi:tellurite resistance protein
VTADRHVLLFAGLAHVAWADGVLRPGEVEFFDALIEGLALPAERALALLRLVARPPDPATLDWTPLDDADRRHLLRTAYALACADGCASEDELLRLRDLGARLGLTWDEALALVGRPLAW